MLFFFADTKSIQVLWSPFAREEKERGAQGGGGGGGVYAWTPLLGGIVFILFQLGGA